LPKVFTLD